MVKIILIFLNILIYLIIYQLVIINYILFIKELRYEKIKQFVCGYKILYVRVEIKVSILRIF